jgi:GAF domain-containing protein
MGSRAQDAFIEAERLAGVVGKMRLASMSSVTSAEAASIQDTPELIARLERGVQRLREQVARRAPAPTAAPIAADIEIIAELRRHARAHHELLSHRDALLGDSGATVRRVCETSAETLRVHRVSVWVLAIEPQRIRCLDLFERAERRHSGGNELFASEFPAYFDALATERTIAAHDAVRDPRTSCFAESYLVPLAIEAMLDVPIRVRGKMRGVVCHEHVGAPRVWNADEESFAYLMSSFVGLALELELARSGHPAGP